MRIIVVNDNATVTGGATKVALLGAKSLAERGIDVHFVSGSDDVSSEYQSVPNLTFHTLGHNDQTMSFRKLVDVAYLDDTYEKVKALILAGDPKSTIVHLHCWKTGISPSVLVAAEDAGAHFVSTFHDYHVACPQGQFFNGNQGKICHLSPGGLSCVLTHCTQSRTILPKWAEVYRYRVQKGKGGMPSRLQNAILLSDKFEEIVGPFLPPSCRRFRVRNPIDSIVAPRVEVETNSTFVFSGRLSHEKDPMTVLKAAREISAEVRFLGDGPLLGALEAEGYSRASFSGWIAGSQVLEEMAKARAMVISSIWYEVKPLAPLEAMGRGIPVLASNCTTTVDDIENEVTGFTFRAGDPHHLAEQMAKMLDNNRARKMSELTHERFWADPPNLEAHTSELLTVYRQILG